MDWHLKVLIRMTFAMIGLLILLLMYELSK
jgi:hypothetical protein